MPSSLVPVDHDPFENLTQATNDLGLSPQEQALYQMHLANLTGPGGVDNPSDTSHPNGSRSTLYQSVQEHGGKFYNIPTVWNGKREVQSYTKPDGTVMDVPNQTALDNVAKAGWSTFPSYADPDEADARYAKMHDYMEKDTAQYLQNRGRVSVVPVDHDPFSKEKYSEFRRSENIEDRRNDKPIDTVTWPRPDGILQMPNVFETGDGTMVALNAATDFIRQPATPSSLSIAAGVNDIKLVPVDHDPFLQQPEMAQ